MHFQINLTAHVNRQKWVQNIGCQFVGRLAANVCDRVLFGALCKGQGSLNRRRVVELHHGAVRYAPVEIVGDFAPAPRARQCEDDCCQTLDLLVCWPIQSFSSRLFCLCEIPEQHLPNRGIYFDLRRKVFGASPLGGLPSPIQQISSMGDVAVIRGRSCRPKPGPREHRTKARPRSSPFQPSRLGEKQCYTANRGTSKGQCG